MLIEAEERGITQANVDEVLKQAQADPSQAALRRFLGVDGGLGSKLGLPDDFVVQVIRATGHYGEIYDRHLGRECGDDLECEPSCWRQRPDGGSSLL